MCIVDGACRNPNFLSNPRRRRVKKLCLPKTKDQQTIAIPHLKTTAMEQNDQIEEISVDDFLRCAGVITSLLP
jgi:hypothetical protein